MTPELSNEGQWSASMGCHCELRQSYIDLTLFNDSSSHFHCFSCNFLSSCRVAVCGHLLTCWKNRLSVTPIWLIIQMYADLYLTFYILLIRIICIFINQYRIELGRVKSFPSTIFLFKGEKELLTNSIFTYIPVEVLYHTIL